LFTVTLTRSSAVTCRFPSYSLTTSVSWIIPGPAYSTSDRAA
jgi:hypothetical protein